MANSGAEQSVRGIRTGFSAVVIRLGHFSERGWLPTLVGFLALTGILIQRTVSTLSNHLAPPGADPGNWLSLAWSITGDGSRLAPWSYPPFSFVLLRGLLIAYDPLVAIRIFGVFAWVALSAAVWVVLLRAFPHLPALFLFGLVLFFSLAGYNPEIFAWGGYTQMIGLAQLVIAIPGLETWLSTGRWRDGIVAIGFSLGVIYTHHLVAAMLPVFWLILFCWLLIHEPEQRRIITSRFLTAGGLVLIFAIPAIPIYWNYMRLLAHTPLNANGYSWANIPDLFTYIFRHLQPLWLTLVFLSLLAPLAFRRNRISATAFAFTWGVLAMFLVFWEVRLLHFLFVGIVFGLGIFFDRAWMQPSTPAFNRARRVLLSLSLIAVLFSMLPQGQKEFSQAIQYYQVAENDVLPALTWLGENTQRTDRVAVSPSPPPGLLGWWVEGLARRPAFYTANLRWLAFEGERQDATIANRIFDPATSAKQVMDMLAENQIRWVWIDKSARPLPLYPLIQQSLLQPAYEDKRVLILHVEPGPTSNAPDLQ